MIKSSEYIGGETSDGYHTFNELYRFRLLYNAAFFNMMWKWEEAEGSQGFDIHKSVRHSDGEYCFGGGWFVVVAQLPTGQITNHYELKDWDLFDIPERDKAAKWDGHTPADVEQRLTKFLQGDKPKKVESDAFGDHTVNVYDDAPNKADYRIELLYKGEKVREMIYPAYRIYTFLAHWKDGELPTEKAS